jgi:hypothetical protein
MTYPSSILVTSQFGVEGTPGTVVAANRIVQAMTVMTKLRRTTGVSRSRSHRYEDNHQGKRVWAEGSYEGVLCYNGITYVLSSLFADPIATQFGASSAYRREYYASNASDVTRKTYSLQVGNAEGVDRYPYGQLASLQCNLSQDEAQVSGDIFAQQPAFNQAQTATPTKIPARPVLRRHVDVFLDATLAAIGSTQVADAFQETLSIGPKWKPVWEHNNGGSKTFRRAAPQPTVITFGFLVPHNAQSRAYCDSLLDGQMRYLRIVCTGGQIGTYESTATGAMGPLGSFALGGAIDYTGVPLSSSPIIEQFMVELPGKIEVAEEEDADSVYARRYSFRAQQDDAFGGIFHALLINSVGAL